MSIVHNLPENPLYEVEVTEKLIEIGASVILDFAVSLGTIAWAIQSIDERMLRNNR